MFLNSQLTILKLVVHQKFHQLRNGNIYNLKNDNIILQLILYIDLL